MSSFMADLVHFETCDYEFCSCFSVDLYDFDSGICDGFQSGSIVEEPLCSEHFDCKAFGTTELSDLEDPYSYEERMIGDISGKSTFDSCYYYIENEVLSVYVNELPTEISS